MVSRLSELILMSVTFPYFEECLNSVVTECVIWDCCQSEGCYILGVSFLS